MNKNVFKKILLLLILILPFQSVDAATYVNNGNYLSEFGIDTNFASYYISSNSSNKYTHGDRIFVHTITDGNYNYISYCLDALKDTIDDASGTITNTSDYKSLGLNSKSQLELLENIMAVGYQTRKEDLSTSGTQKIDIVRSSIDNVLDYLATQVLVWEVIEGSRTGYNVESDYTNTKTPSSLDYAKNGVDNLYQHYKEILNKAKSFATKPTAFNSTQVLNWNDAKNRYEGTFDVGDYIQSGSSPSGLSVTIKNKKATVYSDNPITDEKSIKFSYSLGASTNAPSKLKWFSFSSNTSDMQRLLLAYYTGTQTAQLKVKTEKFKIKLIKKDSNKNDLLGSKFYITKCGKNGKTGSCYSNSTIEVDLTKEASKEVELDKAGYYKIVEEAPDGYIPVSSFYVNLKSNNAGKVCKVNTYLCTEKGIKVFFDGGDSYCAGGFKDILEITFINERVNAKVTVDKIANGGKHIEGVVFELFDKDKVNALHFREENGQYYYDENSDNTFLTTNSSGLILMNYLPQGEYNIKEEYVPEGYTIDPNNIWRQFSIKINGSTIEYEGLSPEGILQFQNSKGEFCFYKIDEDGNYLTSGLFKLQMYNEKKAMYEDKALILKDNVYTIDSTDKSGIYTFSPLANGETCFKDINAKGKYRIFELEAPEGFELPQAQDAQVEFQINEYGYISGTPVLINKKETTGGGKQSEAELIINIQTGQTRIRYVLIILVLGLITGGLFILKKKIDKNKD